MPDNITTPTLIIFAKTGTAVEPRLLSIVQIATPTINTSVNTPRTIVNKISKISLLQAIENPIYLFVIFIKGK